MGRATESLATSDDIDGLARCMDIILNHPDHPEYQYYRDTRDHITAVQDAIADIHWKLNDRRAVHDNSKLCLPEREGFMAATAALKNLEYGTPEYHTQLAAMKPVLDHHYAHNDHHPEHWGDKAWHDMPYTARMEALADWYAATRRMKGGGDLRRSIEHNAQRFGYDEREIRALLLTAAELGWIDAAEHAPVGPESGDATPGA